MKDFDEIIRQATSRLNSDPELQMEIAHELRTHLQDSASEYRDAGLHESDAAERAAEVFGDPKKLGERLFAANRTRMRVRKIAHWSAALVIGPAAAVMAVSVAYTAISSIVAVMALGAGSAAFRGVPGWAQNLPGFAPLQAWNRALARLSPADRFIIVGPPTARTPYERAKAIADRWPDDPVYAANLAGESIFHLGNPPKLDSVEVREAFAAFDRGAELEPDNALYPLFRAAVLLSASSAPAERIPLDPKWGFELPDSGSKTPWRSIDPYRITDQSTFDVGLAALHRAATCKYLDGHSLELMSRRLEVFPPPSDQADLSIRLAVQVSTIPYEANPFRDARRRSESYAVEMAGNGDLNRCDQIIHDNLVLCRLLADSKPLIVQVGFASSMRGMTLTALILAANRANKPELAHKTIDQLMADEQKVASIRNDPRNRLAHQEIEERGDLTQMIVSLPGVRPSDASLAAGREAEYATRDQLMIVALASLLLIAALPAAVRRLFWRGPVVSVYLGWKRQLMVLALAAGLPLLLYAVYAYLTPLGRRNWSAMNSLDRLLVEYLALIAGICAATRFLSDRLFDRRMKEIGLSPPPRNRSRIWTSRIFGIALSAGTAAYLLLWRPRWNFHKDDFVGTWPFVSIWILCLGLFIYTLHCVMTPLPAGGELRFGKIVSRFARPVTSWYVLALYLIALCVVIMFATLPPPFPRRTWAEIVRNSASVAAVLFAIVLIIHLTIRKKSIEITGPNVARSTWLSFVASAMLVLLIAGPFLQRVQRTAIVQEDQSLHLWDQVDNSDWRQLRERVTSPSPTS